MSSGRGVVGELELARRPQDRIRLVAIVTTAAIAASKTGSDMLEDRQDAPVGREYEGPTRASIGT